MSPSTEAQSVLTGSDAILIVKMRASLGQDMGLPLTFCSACQTEPIAEKLLHTCTPYVVLYRPSQAEPLGNGCRDLCGMVTTAAAADIGLHSRDIAHISSFRTSGAENAGRRGLPLSNCDCSKTQDSFL